MDSAEERTFSIAINAKLTEGEACHASEPDHTRSNAQPPTPTAHATARPTKHALPRQTRTIMHPFPAPLPMPPADGDLHINSNTILLPLDNRIMTATAGALLQEAMGGAQGNEGAGDVPNGEVTCSQATPPQQQQTQPPTAHPRTQRPACSPSANARPASTGASPASH